MTGEGLQHVLRRPCTYLGERYIIASIMSLTIDSISEALLK
jgi:hypothetical protein